ncbi:MAG: ATP-binding protein [Gemmatimonadota bacterium]
MRKWAVVAGRLPIVIALFALIYASAVGGRAQLRLVRFSSAPERVGSEEAAAQRKRLQSRMDDELASLRTAALAGRSLPPDSRRAVAVLERVLDDIEHRAVLVRRGDSLVAWAGTLHADPATLTSVSGVVLSPFGLTVYVTDDSASVHTVAASLLYALSPADRLTRGVSQRLASDEVTEGFDFAPPSDSAGPNDLRYVDQGRALFIARPLIPSVGEVRLRMLERSRVRVGIALLVAMFAFLIGVARRGGSPLAVVAGAGVMLACLAVIPLNEFSTRSRLFDPSVYYYGGGRAYSANAAALGLTSATILLLVLIGVRRSGWKLPRSAAAAIAVVTVAVGPFAVRALSRGIRTPLEGAGGALWLVWEVPLCLVATALLVLAHWAGRRAIGDRRGLPIGTGPAIALVAAVMAPLLWEAPGQWPQWYALAWPLAIGAVVLSRSSHRALLACASVAALGATTVVWGSASRGRVELAERDVRGLSLPDEYANLLADRLASRLQGRDLPLTSQELLEKYVTSDLASAGYPVALWSWREGARVATFRSAPLTIAADTVEGAALLAKQFNRIVTTSTRAAVYGVHVVAVPMQGGVLTIMVGPRTRLIGTDPYARWYGLAASELNEPPYSLQLVNDPLAQRDDIRWRREDTELHGDWAVLAPSGPARAHILVDLRGLDTLIPRGGLLVLVDLLAISLVWFLGATADGRVGRWLRMRRRQIRSYRARVSVALFLFFLGPASVFAVWSWKQLSYDAEASRRRLVTETMRAFAGDPLDPAVLTSEARRLDTKFLVYRRGVLAGASDSLFADFAPMGQLLRPDVFVKLNVADEPSATKPENLDGARGMLGYRVWPNTGRSLVLAAPARVGDLLLDRRRRDLGVLVLFATAVGAAAALWLSAMAANQLARPISALREAARAVARGESNVPLDEKAVSEFMPVFTAFRAMARDLGESRSALVETQRRTDAVLRTVASGVIAVDESGRVILANPRAEALLGSIPAAGQAVNRLAVPAVSARVAGFLRSSQTADGFELERDGRTLRGQLTRLTRGGAVLTFDDVTELARAQRVLAWGEMARQVAHEIKNPLTPIRLGVQHLLRARGRDDFDAILRQNVERILTEIDRLDEIARAFSRYGGAPEQRAPAEATDVVAIVQDVIALETLGEGNVQWACDVSGDIPPAFANGDELREVLLNVFENARHAEARTVTATVCTITVPDGSARVRIEVVDDGTGIASDVLPKIFEPHFSTRTSGSGLGLAITRRLVESWQGEVSIESAEGEGSTVRVDLRPV